MADRDVTKISGEMMGYAKTAMGAEGTASRAAMLDAAEKGNYLEAAKDAVQMAVETGAHTITHPVATGKFMVESIEQDAKLLATPSKLAAVTKENLRTR